METNLIENDNRLIPDEAYLYFPSLSEIFITTSKKKVRKMFEGQLELEFDDNETKEIIKLKENIEKKKPKPILLGFWTDSQLLRFLYASDFKIEKTIKSIISHNQWRISTLPPKLNTSIESFLVILLILESRVFLCTWSRS